MQEFMAVQRDHPRAPLLQGSPEIRVSMGFLGGLKLGQGNDRVIYGRKILGGGVHEGDVEQS